MTLILIKHDANISGEVELSASKSESNRALLIQALGKAIHLDNLSDARDTQTMQRLLQSNPDIWDVLDAGTTMRFLTAYLAIKGASKVITGSHRMKERPIGPLVDALRKLGASIDYVEKEGYPPLQISKIESQKRDRIEIPGNISSQYISALLMISPSLEKGLTVHLTSEIFSRPYIQMTLDLMEHFGARYLWEGQTISVNPGSYTAGTYTIEGDWSGASYWYSFLALNQNQESELFLPTLRENSSQGDRRVAEIMSHLGVQTSYEEKGVQLTKSEIAGTTLSLDMKDCPDLAQTLMVVGVVKGVTLHITGLESLKIKETDRIAAMQNELEKLNAALIEEDAKWTLIPSDDLPARISVNTYEDHRMAMAFAPLCQRMEVEIEDREVVNKSYPGFWNEIAKLGIESANR